MGSKKVKATAAEEVPIAAQGNAAPILNEKISQIFNTAPTETASAVKDSKETDVNVFLAQIQQQKMLAERNEAFLTINKRKREVTKDKQNSVDHFRRRTGGAGNRSASDEDSEEEDEEEEEEEEEEELDSEEEMADIREDEVDDGPEDEDEDEDEKAERRIKLSRREALKVDSEASKVLNFEDSRDPAVLSRTLFVGNVPITCFEKKISKKFRSLFVPFGTVSSIRFRSIMAEKPGQSLKVTYLTKKHVATQTSLTAYVVFGKKIKFPSKAAPKRIEPQPKLEDSSESVTDVAQPDPEPTISSNNEPETVTEQTSTSKFPYIRELSPEEQKAAESAVLAAKAALQGSLFEDHHLRLDICRKRAPPAPPSSSSTTAPTKESEASMLNKKRSVFVGNVAFAVDEEALWKAFEAAIGPVSNVRLIRDKLTGLGKGFAYVEFKEVESTKKAVEGKTEVKISGRPARISPYHGTNKMDKMAKQKANIEASKASLPAAKHPKIHSAKGSSIGHGPRLPPKKDHTGPGGQTKRPTGKPQSTKAKRPFFKKPKPSAK